MAKESGVAKSIGDQKEEDMKSADQLLYNYLRTGKKVSNSEANYRGKQNYDNKRDIEQSCDK